MFLWSSDVSVRSLHLQTFKWTRNNSSVFKLNKWIIDASDLIHYYKHCLQSHLLVWCVQCLVLVLLPAVWCSWPLLASFHCENRSTAVSLRLFFNAWYHQKYQNQHKKYLYRVTKYYYLSEHRDIIPTLVILWTSCTVNNKSRSLCPFLNGCRNTMKMCWWVNPTLCYITFIVFIHFSPFNFCKSLQSF